MTQILQGSQYSGFQAVRTHVHMNGLAMMPTAGPFPYPAQVVALHGGLDFDVIAYSASRDGEPPVIPSPIVINPNRIFLAGQRTGTFPIKGFGGVTTYIVTGWMIFGIRSPEGLNSTFMLGNLPFPGLDMNEAVPGAYFSISLINQNLTQTLCPVPARSPPLLNIIAAG